MLDYYQGGLPQGAQIRSELDPEHTYEIPGSTILCFPFKMRRHYQQVVIDAADTTRFESCFIPVLRAWPSKEAAGMSITSSPNSALTSVNLGPNGCRWNFWLLDVVAKNDLKEADIYQWINDGTTYWFNIQNLQNKPANFWLRFTFHGAGITFVE